MIFQEIHERNILVEAAVSAVCPIESIRYPSDDPATWSIQPAAGATTEQIAAGNAELMAFDVSTVKDKSRRNKIDAFVVSDDIHAEALRGLGRTILASLSNFIGKYNAAMTILALGRFPTPTEAASLIMPVRDFATLMEVAKAAAKNETNPNK